MHIIDSTKEVYKRVFQKEPLSREATYLLKDDNEIKKFINRVIPHSVERGKDFVFSCLIKDNYRKDILESKRYKNMNPCSGIRRGKYYIGVTAQDVDDLSMIHTDIHAFELGL